MNVVSILEENARLFSRSIAVIDDAAGKIITYQELWDRIEAAACGLNAIGIGRGDRVALYLPNGYEFIVSYFAILKIGALAVPFNILYKNVEIKRIMQNAQTKAIIGANKEISRELPLIRDELPDLRRIIGVGDQKETYAEIRFEDWLRKSGEVPIKELDDHQPAAIHFTSGTTGKIKGAILSHHNIAANAKINGHYLLGLNDQDRVLGLSPFCHVYYFQVVLGPLCVGACTVTLPRSSPLLALAAIEKYQVTHLSTVPTMFRYMLQHYQDRKYDLSSWRVAGSAAVNINLDLVREVERTFAVDFFDTYGSTEASSTITYTRLRHYKPGSVGNPAHGYRVKVIDDQGNQVGTGEVGELIVKGPGIFNGYWEMPETTKEAFTPDGWYKSGDLARKDDEGAIYILGRKKDVIISGGYKIYPWEIEELLLSHPDIADAVVVGKEDGDLGEVPLGYVILKPDAVLSLENIQDFCRKRLAKYKCPREILFKTEFPRAPSGKILKRYLECKDR